MAFNEMAFFAQVRAHTHREKKKKRRNESRLSEQFSVDTLKASKGSFVAVSSSTNYSDLL